MATGDVALSGAGRAWRVLFTVAVIAALAVGSTVGSNKLFPAGPMTQYAFYIAPNGRVDSTTLYADTTAGTHVHVKLNPQGVGVKRADIEAQLPRIIAHPELLRTVATAERRLHPNQPQYTRIYVVRTVIHLRNRVPTSRSSHVLVAWTVTP
jgi:hypothetical protein